jgi:hypothetical protein
LSRSLINELKAGDHIAFFYRNRAEQLAWAIPYIQSGLERNERCLYIADNNSVSMILQELRDAGVDVDGAYRKGSLNVVTKQETYLRHGLFEPSNMIADLQAEVERTLKDGYSAFRATGEMSWALDLPSALARLVEYEVQLHQEFPKEFIGFCQYDLNRFSPAMVKEMKKIHPVNIEGGKLFRAPVQLKQPAERSATSARK